MVRHPGHPALQSPSDDHPTATTIDLEAALKRAQHTLLGHPLLQPLTMRSQKKWGE